ncbi:phage tail assembly chaperone [Ihubacter sp. rT4E-8]|uniref:phage tail assembly chaperone n=1 Tax=Ihubacter sp. rT4E-8 TaxID=3242369 RepID=UPI003CE8CFF2
MSDLSRFLKANKIKRENTTFAATKSLVDAKGNPLPWTIKPLITKENDAIRDECMIEVPVKGKPNMFRPKLDTSKYIGKMICACVVEPNLYDKDLQDSYGVMSPEDLLKEMIDNPGEYQEFATFVQNFNGFNTTLEDKVEEAKN